LKGKKKNHEPEVLKMGWFCIS